MPHTVPALPCYSAALATFHQGLLTCSRFDCILRKHSALEEGIRAGFDLTLFFLMSPVCPWAGGTVNFGRNYLGCISMLTMKKTKYLEESALLDREEKRMNEL